MTWQRAERQIGKAIATQVIARDEPITLLATSRQGVDFGLTPNHPKSKVEYPKLDVTSDSSIAALLKLVKERFDGRVDVVILNAGGGHWFEDAANSTFGPEAAVKSLDLSRSFQISTR